MAKAVLLTAIIIILLFNSSPAQFFLLPTYAYQNKDGSFRYCEERVRNGL